MDIYVGNLAYKTTDDDLRALFSEHGEVTSARVVTDRVSGQSKGFGFVEMPDRDAAQKAIDAINGQDLQGRKLRVNASLVAASLERYATSAPDAGCNRGNPPFSNSTFSMSPSPDVVFWLRSHRNGMSEHASGTRLPCQERFRVLT